MLKVEKLIRRIRVWFGRPRPSFRLLAAVLAAVTVTGVVWLAYALAGNGSAGGSEERLSPADPVVGESALRRQGIACRREGGVLVVPVKSAARAREILAAANPGAAQAPSALEALAGETTIWRTDAQNAMRWQAAKMAALGKLIASMRSVESATVMFDPGQPHRLGHAATRPTAAVEVVLTPGANMTRRLVSAIAELVSGSIAGMTLRDVCIVDGAGQSYRAAEQTAAGGGGLADLRAAEEYFEEKVLRSLSHIGKAVVGVHVDCTTQPARCRGVAISVPWSYLAAAQRAAGDHDDGAGPAEQAARQLDRVRLAAMTVIGSEDPGDVQVDWYYDVPDSALGQGGAPAPADGREWTARAAAVVGAIVTAAALAAAALVVVILHRIRRRRGRDRPLGRSLQPVEPCAVLAAQPFRPFAFLDDLANDDLLWLLENEHPQTVALVLSHIPPARAGDVLGRFPSVRQVDVARRIASSARPDPEVVRQVAGSLAAHLADRGRMPLCQPDGAAALAEIIRHTTTAAESDALRKMIERQPAPGRSVRRRVFAFEDVVGQPAGVLRAAVHLLHNDEVAIALRTAGERLKAKLLKSLPSAAARRVRQQMERIGPVRLSDVEAAQQRVVEAVRQVVVGEYLPAPGACETENQIRSVNA